MYSVLNKAEDELKAMYSEESKVEQSEREIVNDSDRIQVGRNDEEKEEENKRS